MSKCKTCKSEHLPIYPTIGGCWFCDCDMSPMEFDTEFDTWYHPECLKRAIAEGDEEAIIIDKAK